MVTGRFIEVVTPFGSVRYPIGQGESVRPRALEFADRVIDEHAGAVSISDCARIVEGANRA